MRLSLEWLKDYIELDISAQELAHRLTMAGITVENIEELENDMVLELDLTPNRGDCLGIINIAREVSALTGKPLDIPQAQPDELDEKIEDYVKITIQSSLCKRYGARVMKNVRVAPSPVWMQERLLKAGIRPINNVVDVTNYVMLETNQPMHAFDYELLEGRQIVVREAQAGEELVTLDGSSRELQPGMLVIADAVKPVALAGIMGGESSEIGEDTTTILLESAIFDGTSIRRTAKKVGLRTESSMRFEKGVDIGGVVLALDRAARLLEILGAGEVVQGVCDVYPHPAERVTIRLRPDRVNYVLGTSITAAEIEGFLKKLRFPVEVHADHMLVDIPSYRPDLTIEEDLIEEVARLYGYDNISSQLEPAVPTHGYRTDYQRFQEKLLAFATHRMHQVITYSFINPRWLDTLGIPEDNHLRNTVKVANPFSEEQGIMRTTLLPGLLEVVSRNLARRNEDLTLVEKGSVFWPNESDLQPREVLMMAGMVTGKVSGGWQVTGSEMDFFYLKGLIEDLLGKLHLPEVKFLPFMPEHSYHPGRTAAITVEGKQLGTIGEIHPQVLKRADIDKRVCAFEIDVLKLFEAVSLHQHQVRGISKYPAVKRDLALVVSEETNAADLAETIKKAGTDLLAKVDLFDVYRSPQIGQDKKSLAYALTFQSYQSTLQDDEISGIVERILQKTAEVHGASLR
jgi:phenylalanyl-tRNA synthetase beta chain